MTKIEELVKNDLKVAMQAKDEKIVSTLRLLISAWRNKEISLRQGGKAELTDEEVIEIVSSEIKKRKDSVEAYRAGNRPDLSAKEEQEIEILKKYLPEQATDEEIEKIVREIAANEPSKNFGKIMGQAMTKLKGKTEGNKVGGIVKKIIG
jgi:hypothetical protein